MPKTRAQKEAILTEVTDKFETSKGVVFATDSGLTVGESQALRGELREAGVALTGIKKTLLGKALEKSKLDALEAEIAGTLFVATSAEDEVLPAKVLAGFAKKNDKVTLVGGVMEGKTIGTEQVVALSKIPGKDELYAKMVGSLNAPISGFVNVLAGNIRGLVYVLNALKEKKEAGV